MDAKRSVDRPSVEDPHTTKPEKIPWTPPVRMIWRMGCRVRTNHGWKREDDGRRGVHERLRLCGKRSERWNYDVMARQIGPDFERVVRW